MKTIESSEDIVNYFKELADPAEAVGMKAYMRDKFEFLGIKKDRREAATKAYWVQHNLPIGKELNDLVLTLFEQPYRELHYMAMQLLEKPMTKKSEAGQLPILVKLVQTASWWDTVDYIAAKLVGGYLSQYPDLERSEPLKWIESDDFWLQRTAILYQLKYKQKTDAKRLFEFILKTAHLQEFFIRKAAGWALREYSKTDEKAVRAFIAANEDQLSGLTKREGLKWVEKNGEG